LAFGVSRAKRPITNARNSCSFTVEESSDTLEFSIVREPGWIESIDVPALATIAIWVFLGTGSHYVTAFACGANVSIVVGLNANRIHGKQARFRVTRKQFTAPGNLDRILTTEIADSASDVSSLRWDSGAEGRTAGLYENSGWIDILLLPYIHEDQAATIGAAIERRFPEICIDLKPISILFGDRNGLTTLDLNSRSDEGQEMRP
jgi:hypothetical protein